MRATSESSEDSSSGTTSAEEEEEVSSASGESELDGYGLEEFMEEVVRMMNYPKP